MYITNVSLYNDNHIWLIVYRNIERYARYTSENDQVNIVKYRKPIYADNVYFIIIQYNKSL